MKKVLQYGRLRKITYTFTEQDIINALKYFFKIETGESSEFNMWDGEYDDVGDYSGPGGAEIIVKFIEDLKDASES